MNQPTLFDYVESKKLSPPIAERNEKLTTDDRLRLSSQNGLILERLQRGPATGPELMNIAKAMNISARISNVRKYLEERGQTVASRRIDGGVWEYTIEGKQ